MCKMSIQLPRDRGEEIKGESNWRGALGPGRQRWLCGGQPSGSKADRVCKTLVRTGPCQKCALLRMVPAHTHACKGTVTQGDTPALLPHHALHKTQQGLCEGDSSRFRLPPRLQPSESQPWHQTTRLCSHPASSPPPAPHRHHPAPAALPRGQWEMEAVILLWLRAVKKALKGGGTGLPSFLPFPPRTRPYHVGSKRRKEKRVRD